MCAPQALESRVGLGIGRESSCTAGIGLRVKDLTSYSLNAIIQFERKMNGNGVKGFVHPPYSI